MTTTPLSLSDPVAVRQRKVLWWVLAVVCTIAATITPFMLGTDGGMTLWAVGVGACGLLLGLLDSSRPWTFALLLALSYAVGAAVVAGIDSAYDIVLRLQFGLTFAIPAAIGSYAGAVARKLARGRMKLHGVAAPRPVQLAALGGGALSAAMFFGLPYPSGPIISFAFLFAGAAVLGFFYRDRLWRWIFYLGYGIPLIAAVRLVIITLKSSVLHSSIPFELSLALIVALLPALSGSMLGRALVDHRRARHA